MDIVKIKFFGAKEGKGFFHSDDHISVAVILRSFGGLLLRRWRQNILKGARLVSKVGQTHLVGISSHILQV